MSTHPPSHWVGVSPPQLSPQLPPLHSSPSPHATPQAPQWARDVPVSKHPPSQASCPGGQLVAHTPAEHTSDAPHEVSQSPQRAGSLDTSTHSVPQSASPAPQVTLPSEPASVIGSPTTSSPQLKTERDRTSGTIAVEKRFTRPPEGARVAQPESRVNG